MKKLWLLGVLGGLGYGLPTMGQVQDGTRYWGGTITARGEAQSNKGEFDNSTSKGNQYDISPELQWGKFTNATTMIGLGARYSFSWGKNSAGSPSVSNSNSYISQSVTLLPFIRKYKPLGERWAIFLHAEIGPTYNWSKSKSSFSGSDYAKSHYWQYELSVKPGVVYFSPKKNLAIEGYADVLSLGASYTNFPNDLGRNFNFATGFSTDFPSYFTVRIAKYLPINAN